VTLDPSIPEGFDYVDLGELLDVAESLLGYVAHRVGTYDEEEGEAQIYERANSVLQRYRAAS